MRAFLSLALSIALMIASVCDAKPHHDRTHAIPAYRSTTDLTDPVNEALKAKARGHRVLVVFDIDNTLLTMPQDLGSDTWFNWQKSLIAADTPNGDAAFQDLILNNTVLLQIGRLKPTQTDTAALIARLQARHIPVYALSARGTDLRGATETALKANGIDLSSAPECGPPLCSRRGNLSDAQARAAARLAHIRLPATPFKPFTISDGVVMSAGQNKGLLLALLLKSLPGKAYTDIWFVDDTFHNITDVQNAAPQMTARVHPYSYERFWPDSAAFMQDKTRQAKTDVDFSHIRETLCTAMQAALCITPFHGSEPGDGPPTQ